MAVPKHQIKVESRSFTGQATNKKSLPSTAGVGQTCLKCGTDCVGGYVPHLWRKQCVSCGCARDYHSSLGEYHELVEQLKPLTLHESLSDDTKMLDRKYVWYPPGVDYATVEKYMESLPKTCIPYRSSNAELQRRERFLHQHPSHDSNLQLCHEMPDLEKKRHSKFREKRTSRNLSMGRVSIMPDTADKCTCRGCSEAIAPNSIVVTSDKTPEKVFWHGKCFRCSTCMDLLVDLLYFYSPDKDAVFCGRHHAETMVPRCQGCDELIFSGTYTEAKGKCWHKKHFTCIKCDMELHGKKYGEQDDNVYCEVCYDRYAATKCQKCKESIGLGFKKMTVGSNTWHKECFVCVRCDQNVHDQKYYVDDAGLLCYDCCQKLNPVAQCQGCKSAISTTVKYIKHKHLCWHVDCFKCTICQSFLADGHFQEREDKIMCKKCYTTKFSKKCATCQESIGHEGIQFGLNIYHKNCFNCSKCKKNLIGESKIKDCGGQPVCLGCRARDAKKCFRCNGPITSRHTVYKGQPFHLECFKCNLCGTSIGTANYYETSLNETLCEKCASYK